MCIQFGVNIESYQEIAVLLIVVHSIIHHLTLCGYMNSQYACQ